MHLLLLAIGGLLFNGSPKHADTITFSCPGATVENALKQLGEATSLRLDAAKDLQGLPLIICADGMDRNKLFASIEDCLSAKWNKDQDHWTLVPDSFKIKARTDEATKNYVEQLSYTLTRQYSTQRLRAMHGITVQSLSKAAASTVSDEQNAALKGAWNMPAQSMFHYLAGSLSAQDLATIQRGQRIVYSLHPNKMQRPFTQAMLDAVQECQKQEESFVAQLKAAGFQPNLIIDPKMRDSIAKMLSTQKPLQRGIFTVASSDLLGAVFLSFTDLDTQWSMEEEFDNRPIGTPRLQYARLDTLRKFSDALPEDGAMDFSDRALKMAKQFNEARGYDRAIPSNNGSRFERSLTNYHKLTQAELQDWLEPDRVEPLSWFVGEGLSQIAKIGHYNIVASPIDECLGDGGRTFLRGAPRPKDFLMQLTKELRSGVAELIHGDGDTLILRQDCTSTAYNRRAFDRRTLASVLKDLQQSPIVSPQHYERLGIHSFMEALAWTNWLQIGTPCMISQCTTSPLYLPFIESLSDTQLRSLETGNDLLLRNLSTDQRNKLAAILYGPTGNLAQMASNAQNLDVTEAFPNGLPADGWLSLKAQKTATIISWLVEGNLSAKGSTPTFVPNSQIATQLEGYQHHIPYLARNYTFTIANDTASWRSFPTMVDAQAVGPVVDKWQKLPSTFVDAIEKMARGG